MPAWQEWLANVRQQCNLLGLGLLRHESGLELKLVGERTGNNHSHAQHWHCISTCEGAASGEQTSCYTACTSGTPLRSRSAGRNKRNLRLCCMHSQENQVDRSLCMALWEFEHSGNEVIRSGPKPQTRGWTHSDRRKDPTQTGCEDPLRPESVTPIRPGPGPTQTEHQGSALRASTPYHHATT